MLDSMSRHGYAYAMLQNWNLYKEVLYIGVVCVYKARVGGIYRVRWLVKCHKLSRGQCCRGADQPGSGPTGQPTGPTWHGLWSTGLTWSEVDRGDLGLTFY
jgi:hypothetical protein